MMHPQSTQGAQLEHALHKSTSDHTMDATSLLEKLRAEGFTNELVGAEDILQQAEDMHWPLYLHVLLFLGAGFAALFLGLSLVVLQVIDISSALSTMVLSINFVGGAFGLRLTSTPTPTLASVFFAQLSLLCMIIGKSLFTFGVFLLFDVFWVIPLGLFLLSCATYFTYPVLVDRFVSSALTLLATFSLFFVFDIHVIWYHAFIVAQLALLAALVAHPKCTYAHIPLLYAVVISLGIMLTTHGLFYLYGIHDFISLSILYSTFFTITLSGIFACALILLMFWLVDDWRTMLTKPFVLLTTGILVLAWVTSPGILFGLGLLILGHARRERLLTTLGVLFLALFIWHYYYFLVITLLEKAAVLVITGLILLLGRWYCLRQVGGKGAPTKPATPSDTDAFAGAEQ